MHVLEITTPFPPLFHDHIRSEEVVFHNSRIELHLGANDRIDEGIDKFIKSVEEKWYIEDERTAETLRIMVLKYAQPCPRDTECWVFAFITIIDEYGDRPGSCSTTHPQKIHKGTELTLHQVP